MARKKQAKRKATTRSRYFAASRRLAASYVFIAPLFALYQGALAIDQRVRNGVEPVLAELVAPLREYGLVFVNCLVLGFLLVAIARMKKDRARIRFMYGWMLLESIAWAVALVFIGTFTHSLIRSLSLSPLAASWMISIGAGVYEELLFRFLLMGGLILILHRGLGGNKAWVLPLAIVVAALLFSWAHTAIGGETWDRRNFWFRAWMGVLLGALYWARGLGVVVYTHALYNGVVLTWDQLDG